MKVSTTNKATGEVIEVSVDNQEELVNAWLIVQGYEKAAKELREKLKEFVVYGDNGTSPVIGNYQFRVSNVQRMNYDKAVLRQALDEDTLDLLLIPHKPTVDKYLKEHLEDLGEASTVIRKSMIPDGKAYQVIKLEKVSRV